MTEVASGHKVIVDIAVANLQIRAFRPDETGEHFPMPNNDVGKVLFLATRRCNLHRV